MECSPHIFCLSKMANFKKATFSVVSHGQLGLVKEFLSDFRSHSFNNVEIILTLNIPEDESKISEFQALPISIVRNSTPKGFGANHNFAFSRSKGDVFVVVNPDIRLNNFNMEPLLEVLTRPEVGACAPVVLGGNGHIEDSVRRYPTLGRLFKRIITRQNRPDYAWGNAPIAVDWAAGMFVAFRPDAFNQVRGFDERFFLYYEDADICRRLAKVGWSTMLQPATSVIHNAQRASRRNFRHLTWNVESAFRFLFLS